MNWDRESLRRRRLISREIANEFRAWRRRLRRQLTAKERQQVIAIGMAKARRRDPGIRKPNPQRYLTQVVGMPQQARDPVTGALIWPEIPRERFRRSKESEVARQPRTKVVSGTAWTPRQFALPPSFAAAGPGAYPVAETGPVSVVEDKPLTIARELALYHPTWVPAGSPEYEWVRPRPPRPPEVGEVPFEDIVKTVLRSGPFTVVHEGQAYKVSGKEDLEKTAKMLASPTASHLQTAKAAFTRRYWAIKKSKGDLNLDNVIQVALSEGPFSFFVHKGRRVSEVKITDPASVRLAFDRYARKAVILGLLERYKELVGSAKPNPSLLPAVIGGATAAVVSNALRNPVSGPADSVAARELEIYIENDSELNRRMRIPIFTNLMRKRARGVFDKDKAAKLFMYLVDEGAKKYIKEFGTSGERIDSVFNRNTRLAVARSLTESFIAEADLGNYDYLIKGGGNLFTNPHLEGGTCSVCGGELGFMGGLGNLEWYRCRNCGGEFSVPAPQSNGHLWGRTHVGVCDPCIVELGNRVVQVFSAPPQYGPCDKCHRYRALRFLTLDPAKENPLLMTVMGANPSAPLFENAKPKCNPRVCANPGHRPRVKVWKKPPHWAGPKNVWYWRILDPHGEQVTVRIPCRGREKTEVGAKRVGNRHLREYLRKYRPAAVKASTHPMPFTKPNAKRKRCGVGTALARGSGKGARANPGSRRRLVTMPLAKFAAWVRARRDPKLWADFQKKIEGYRKWTHGTLPRTVTVEAVEKPGVNGVWLAYDAGRSPEALYTMPKGSKRKGAWRHAWETAPSIKHDPEAGIIMQKLKGKSKITDFYHH